MTYELSKASRSGYIVDKAETIPFADLLGSFKGCIRP